MLEFALGMIGGVIITFIVAMNTIGKENFEFKNKIKEMVQYIEDREFETDWNSGDCRELTEIISSGDMPKLYYDLKGKV